MSAGLSIDVRAKTALQLTVTKTSLSIFTELVQVGNEWVSYPLFPMYTYILLSVWYMISLLSVQAYTEKKVMAFEEVDTPETYDAAFMIVNKVQLPYTLSTWGCL